LQERQFLQGGVHLRIDQDQICLFDCEIGLQIGNLRAEVLRGLRETLCVEAERARCGVGEIREDGVQIVCEAVCGRLQKILNVREVARKICRESALIDAERAVVIQADAKTLEVADAVVAGVGEGHGGEQRGLRFAKGTVRLKRTAAGSVGGDSELRVDVLDGGVVSYADFITLLFAFFVVLYASSQVDKRKVGKLALAIQVAFQQMGVFETSNTQIPLSDSEAVPFSQVQVVENSERTSDMERFVQPMKGILSPTSNAPMKNIQEELEKALSPEIKNKIVEVRAKREGLVVSLREVGFFESGNATMRASSKGAIDRLAAVLGSRTEFLRIEGHTDNVPIHNIRFASNWELSSGRATELIKLFVENYRFDPARLSAAGYAEFHPVASNDTPEGRARNRRVDVVILNPVRTQPEP